MAASTTEAITGFAFVTAILKELDARQRGFADAVCARVQREIDDMASVENDTIIAQRDSLIEGMEWVQSELRKEPVTG